MTDSLLRFLRKARYPIILLLTAGLLFAHILYFTKFSTEYYSLYRQLDELEETIISEAGIPRDERFSANRSVLISASPRAGAHAALQSRQRRVSNLQDILGLAFLIWPIALISGGIFVWFKLWRGEGLEPDTLEKRRNRMRVFAVLSTALILTTSIILWRFTAARVTHFERIQIFLIAAALVSIAAPLFIKAVLNFLQSPMSKLSEKISSVSPIYLFALQMGAVALVAFITAGDLSLMRDEFGGSWTILMIQSVAGIMAVVALGSIMLGYLRVPEKKTSRSSIDIVKKADSSVQHPAKHTEFPPPDSELSELRARIEELATLIPVHNQSPNGSAIEMRAETPKEPAEIVKQRSELTRDRLLMEVRALTNRGNLNLIIGSVTSLIAATILWMLVAQAPAGTLGSAALVGYYIPRISVAVFIEVFSFFFLRLYRNGLAAIMYYQNELTNLESRALALEIAAAMPLEATLPQLLQNLSRTDRNLVLKTGETTVELEKIKVEQENIQSLFGNMLSKVADLTDSVKK